MSSECPEPKSDAEQILDIEARLDWKLSPQGRPQYVLPSRKNLCLLLAEHPQRPGHIVWDDFHKQTLLAGEPLRDDHLVQLCNWLDERYQMRSLPTSLVAEVASYLARKRSFNPLQNYLCSLQWDGVDRADHWLITAIGAEDTALHCEYSRKWLIQAVARALEPGCKADTVLVLAGKQGIGKSTLFRLITGDEWFNDTDLDLRNKDCYLQLQSAWVHEVSEFSSFRRAQHDRVKAFISSTEDRFRLPYNKFAESFKRHCVFVATTNEDEFLVDATGSRRFWAVPVTRLDRRWLIENRDQLWAEAVVRYRSGEEWWLDAGYELLRQASAESYQESDPWEGAVASFVADWGNGRGFTMSELLGTACSLPIDRQDKRAQARAGAILRRIGCTKRDARVDGAVRKVWLAPRG